MANIESKKFYTRVQLKYDTWANWNTETAKAKIPLKGEVCLVEVPTGASSGMQDVPPSVLMKVGDGEKSFGALPWLSALAADVHAWAKKSETEFKAWLVESVENGGVGLATAADLADAVARIKTVEDGLKDLGEAIGVPEDYDVAANGTAFGRIADLEEAIGTGGTGAGSLSQKVSKLEEYVGVPASGEGEEAVPATGLHAAVAAAQAQADKGVADAADAKAAADAEKKRVDTLVGADADKSVRVIAAEEIAAQLIPGNADEALDTLEEIAAWIQAHPEDASAMNADILDVRKEVYGTEDGKAPVDGDNAGKSRIDLLEEGLAAEIAATNSDISRIEGLITGTGEGSVATQIDAAKTELKGDASKDTKDSETIAGAKKYAEEKASAAETAAKDYADGLNEALTGRVQAVENKLEGVTKVTDSIATAKQEAITEAGNNAATAIETAKSELIGTTGDTATADTIFGAKAHADAAVAGEAGRVNALIGTLPEGQTTVVGAIAAAEQAAKGEAASKASAAETAAKEYADGIVEDAKEALIGTAEDGVDANTIAGAKAYADDKVADVASNVNDLSVRPFVAVEKNGKINEEGVENIYYVTFYCGTAEEMF